MILESMEQRVANTPVALLCDECLKKDCCKWIDEMRAAVVNTDKGCYGRPFKPEAWTCQLYLPCTHVRKIAESIEKKAEDGLKKWKPDYITPSIEYSQYYSSNDDIGMIKGGG